jgi:antitoxin (DNA-binding transcriptional repressor) of toxin-antitoxin stability system
MSMISVSEARSALPDIIERVLAGEEITLTRHGQPVAVVVRPDALRIRRAGAAMADAHHVRTLLDRGRGRPVNSVPGISAERADELVAQVHDDRNPD